MPTELARTRKTCESNSNSCQVLFGRTTSSMESRCEFDVVVCFIGISTDKHIEPIQQIIRFTVMILIGAKWRLPLLIHHIHGGIIRHPCGTLSMLPDEIGNLLRHTVIVVVGWSGNCRVESRLWYSDNDVLEEPPSFAPTGLKTSACSSGWLFHCV